MKLDFDQLKSVIRGISYVENTDEGFVFHRFTREEEEYYKAEPDFYLKALATSGVQAEFVTDAKSIRITADVKQGSSRGFFAFDFMVSGRLYAQFKNFEQPMENGQYISAHYSDGIHSAEISLPEGEKSVRIVFPWSVKAILKELELVDATVMTPIRRKTLMLAYGDSITQGYDTVCSHSSYANLVANYLGAELINKGIGAEMFKPALVDAADASLRPDYITVAYGTNDWSKRSREDYEVNCIAFYKALCKKYPDAKIYAISPIWRKDHRDYRPFGPFDGVHEIFAKTCQQCPSVILINPWDFIPHNEKFFSDLYLHPNDAGFKHYATNLQQAIAENLGIGF